MCFYILTHTPRGRRGPPVRRRIRWRSPRRRARTSRACGSDPWWSRRLRICPRCGAVLQVAQAVAAGRALAAGLRGGGFEQRRRHGDGTGSGWVASIATYASSPALTRASSADRGAMDEVLTDYLRLCLVFKTTLRLASATGRIVVRHCFALVVCVKARFEALQFAGE